MEYIRLVLSRDFLLFLLGVYGPQIALYTQKLIADCDKNIFTFFFMFGTYLLIVIGHTITN